MSLTREEAQHIFDHVMRRAATDLVFRQGLLTDPRSALEAELGLSLPDQFNIRFIENGDADLTIVLPDFTGSSGELSDRDLDPVAGGVWRHVPDAFARCMAPVVLAGVPSSCPG